jgi:hypothetical protein
MGDPARGSGSALSLRPKEFPWSVAAKTTTLGVGFDGIASTVTFPGTSTSDTCDIVFFPLLTLSPDLIS